MMKVEMLPQKGMLLDGVLIGLGMDITTLELNYDIEKYDNVYYLFDGNLQIETENNKICYISCCTYNVDSLCLVFDGHNLCELEAEDIIILLNKLLNEDVSVLENNHTFIWKNSQICCWKEITSEEAEEIVIESKQDGVYEEMLEDITNDIIRAKYFSTIGVGKEGYYDSWLS